MTPLSTIAEVATDTKVSERTLRDVITDLGYSRPPGRKKYLFNAAQVKAIREAVQCRLTIPQAPAEEIASISSVAALPGRSERSALAAETRAVRRMLGMTSSAKSRNVVSLEAERQRHSMTRFDSTKPHGI